MSRVNTNSVTSSHSSGRWLLVPRTTCSTKSATEKMRFQWVLSRDGTPAQRATEPETARGAPGGSAHHGSRAGGGSPVLCPSPAPTPCECDPVGRPWTQPLLGSPAVPVRPEQDDPPDCLSPPSCLSPSCSGPCPAAPCPGIPAHLPVTAAPLNPPGLLHASSPGGKPGSGGPSVRDEEGRAPSVQGTEPSFRRAWDSACGRGRGWKAPGAGSGTHLTSRTRPLAVPPAVLQVPVGAEELQRHRQPLHRPKPHLGVGLQQVPQQQLGTGQRRGHVQGLGRGRGDPWTDDAPSPRSPETPAAGRLWSPGPGLQPHLFLAFFLIPIRGHMYCF